MKPKAWYTSRIADTETTLSRTKKRILRISTLRLLLFIGGICGVIYCYPYGFGITALCAVLTFVPFLLLVAWHSRLFHLKEQQEAILSLNRNELQALAGDNSAFPNGNEYINPQHPYSYDLDVFGPNSLFQTLNRTCTQVGKETLAQWLNEHLLQKAAIEERQACVRELSEHPEWRETFRVTGMINKGTPSDAADIKKWTEQNTGIGRKWWAKALVHGVPTVNIALFLGALLGAIPAGWLGISFGLFVILSFGFTKRATWMQESFGKKLRTLSCYARLISLTQEVSWQSDGMNKLLNQLSRDGQSPSEALRKLAKELDKLDLINNQFLYIILEGGLFFQLRQITRIEQWKETYGPYTKDWINAVGELDALCSLATFAYNHSSYAWPQLSEQPFRFEARNMGHPLMPENKCVRNDAEIPTRPYFLIITGANMAGKSTYLRTIGVNYLLACIGCPVYCESLTLYPALLRTSLRTSDSLAGNESYFFAEMKRLKSIIEQLNEGKVMFIILDEILKGTNSADKQRGSFDLIKQFIRLKANGIIATHDLELGTLAKLFPDNIRNYCFEADIHNDELTFSYRLRNGVAQNMNACFIMRKMGITID